MPSTHCGVIDKRERRAADSGERAADERVRVAIARDADAHRVRGGGRLAHCTQVEARAACARQIHRDNQDDACPGRVDEERAVRKITGPTIGSVARSDVGKISWNW